MTDSKRLLRLKQVVDLIPVGRSTIYDWMGRGVFPKALNLGGGIVAWRESEVLAWIAERPVSSRDDDPGVSLGVS